MPEPMQLGMLGVPDAPLSALATLAPQWSDIGRTTIGGVPFAIDRSERGEYVLSADGEQCGVWERPDSARRAIRSVATSRLRRWLRVAHALGLPVVEIAQEVSRG